jgi:gluconolactonase
MDALPAHGAAMKPEIPLERFEVFAGGLDHPECVAFDRDGNLWAGGEAGQVYRIDPAGRVETVTTLGGFNGGLAFSPGGDLFVCNPSLGIVRVSPSGRHETFAREAGGNAMVCPNFPVFDREGNLYVSDSGKWGQGNGRLARFTPDGSGSVVAGPFGYANGLALTGDERTLFMAESDTRSVWRFELSPDGSVRESQVYVKAVGRMPDGLALDEAGDLYVACYASDDLHRVAATGRKTWLAHDPNGVTLGRPTNLAFGGRDFDEIYVANLGRYTIVRAKLAVRGQPLASQRGG